tara:strand:- start:233 stop:496 length:264 start_codon:yes stop_codon:yes gene_type:complete
MSSKKDAMVIVLITGTTLIATIEEQTSELGEPDCKLIEPYVVTPEGTVEPWLLNVTNQNEVMISSDKILTLVDPKTPLLAKYEAVFD